VIVGQLGQSQQSVRLAREIGFGRHRSLFFLG
jgi:hypothetical protein